eukprot:CAMPEP_0172186986 /NCGR_PEP_ID=MMETSP1050-20130122/21089_1 /TAXON_ID=233186 /ORGANISM="Cryptomonas curvata, Strain CCAP979/52" /LENGTH=513 /DNA_ID=CAMNT_0012861263 /DNA_START=54 /DNA_END=1595 /DNA_ORIENTATION=+
MSPFHSNARANFSTNDKVPGSDPSEKDLKTQGGTVAELLASLLKEVKEQNHTLKEQNHTLKEQSRELALIKSKISSMERGNVSCTASERGHITLKYLDENRMVFYFQGTAAGRPVLDDAEYTKVLGVSSESVLVREILPKIQKILPDRAVVSSETMKWLETQSKDAHHRQKPDAFITHPAFFRVPIKQKIAGDTQLVGIPAHPRLYRGTNILDFKVDDTPAALGELLVHLEHFHNNALDEQKSTWYLKGALFHKKGFMLVTYHMKSVVRIDVAAWNVKGTAELLAKFFSEESERAKVLDELLSLMDLQLAPNPFLGVGGTGFVVKVSRKAPARAGDYLALKVVCGTQGIADLSKEYFLNQALFSHDSKFRNAVRAVDFRNCGKRLGAGMLMDEVGGDLARHAAPRDVRSALESLAAFHRTGYYHGDPRRANLLDCRGTLKWCDLQYAGSSGAALHFCKDITELLRSFGVKLVDDTSAAAAAGEEYVANLLSSSTDHLWAYVNEVVEDRGAIWP